MEKESREGVRAEPRGPTSQFAQASEEQAALVDGGESRLDFVLAEELSVNREFLERFAAPALAKCEPSLELVDIKEVRIRLNCWDSGGEGAALADAGENDIEVDIECLAGTIRLLIEDKLWAEFQPEQARRYAHRSALHPNTVAILVIPALRESTVLEHSHYFKATHTVEDLASWLDETVEAFEKSSGSPRSAAESAAVQRLKWRSQLLKDLGTRRPPAPDHGPTIEFRNFLLEWLEGNVPGAIPYPNSMRTIDSTWLHFKQPRGLSYKPSPVGAVDLYVTEEGFQGTTDDLRQFAEMHPPPDGFEVATDTKGNPVLRWKAKKLIDPANGLPPDQERTPVLDALRAIRAIVGWRAETGDALGQGNALPPANPS